ncbi:archaetidylserine decarboxylase [Thiocystis violacea]|uniref:archaetidylserine decarboxylase n=1 Tax=Thiocystis violacea TaxID=13725 RepID=UPI001907D349|nr:archaetidylserine decarboxylase [Thiocystis violacea]MBK1717067.1 phosphatidylserine decarboxylase [Thiocystis violacea]
MTDSASTRLKARLFIALQHLIPQLWLSERMHGLARLRWKPLKNLLIQTFAHLYRIDMRQALEPDLAAYPHFNAFFTRALKPEARPLDPAPDAILCPVDGAISQIGPITQGRLIQAKGRDYGVRELLALEPDEPHPFDGGTFATIYLAPHDYHRIHMPLAGRLDRMTHVPGRLFSVNATTATGVPDLFARNERVVCRFETETGPMALILVGAIFVGGIETTWAGQITPPHSGTRLKHWDQTADGPANPLERGAEMGRFNLGSTVILLFPPGRARWAPALVPGDKVRLGQRLGVIAGADAKP